MPSDPIPREKASFIWIARLRRLIHRFAEDVLDPPLPLSHITPAPSRRSKRLRDGQLDTSTGGHHTSGQEHESMRTPPSSSIVKSHMVPYGACIYGVLANVRPSSHFLQLNCLHSEEVKTASTLAVASARVRCQVRRMTGPKVRALQRA